MYTPGYYVSRATKMMVQKAVETTEIAENDLPNIYRLGSIVAEVFGRSTPTISDMEIAVIFKTKDYIEQVATGQVELDKVPDMQYREREAKGTRIQQWKDLAQELLKKL